MSPFLQTPVGFTAETLEMLDRAFSDTWCELQARKSLPTSGEIEQTTRREIGKSIIELATAGVRDPERLKKHALETAKQAKPRARAIVHLPG